MIKYSQWVILCCLGCLLGACDSHRGGEQYWWQPARYAVVDGAWIYLPESYDESKTYPMIVFLQGGDPAASPNPRTTKEAGPALVASEKIGGRAHQYARDSFIVVNPHMTVGPRNQRQWYHQSAEVIRVVAAIANELPVDQNRIYLTGLSKGGHGSFGVLKEGVDLFAATVPIAGRVNCKNNCERLAAHPLWIIHREGDKMVEVNYALSVVSHFEEELGLPFHRTHDMTLSANQLAESRILTILPGDSHNAWDEVYRSASFYSWLLAHPRTED